MLCNLWHDSDEMVAVYERADNWISTLTLARSQAAEEAMYSAEKGININRDNGPWLVIDGIVNMLGIVYGWGFLSWGLKTLWAGANLASKWGLFLSWFFTQLGNSYEEWFKVGLTGKSLLSYAMLSAGIQWWLELISPNEFLLWQGNSVVKQYLKEILKSGNKQNLIQVWKLFLKHIGTEIVKEDAQESLQLAAWNLINLRANDQFDLWNGFDVNWDRKNFAATAIITSLTTGIVAWVGFKNHHNNHHPIKQYLQNNPQLYTQVMQTLHQSINREQHIPNITKEDLIQLQKELEIWWFHKFDGEIQFEIPLKNGKCEYLTVWPHWELIEASLSNEEATACFKNGLTTTWKLFEWYENRCILSSWSLFLNNPEYRKLWGDIDVATDVQTFEAIALQKGKQGRTKLEEYQENGEIRDLMFTDISHHQLTISDLSPEEISTLIARGDIRVEFNIIDDNWHLINCEFFPEPKGFWLIQVGTERTQGKINTYNLEGTTLQTVNPELAAMSYIVNLAHEAENNTLATFIQTNGKWKFKDSVRINNLFQYLHEAGIETVQDIKDFITKTKENYAQQVWEEQMITTKNGEKIAINQSQYLKSWLDKLDNVLAFFNDIQSLYTLMQHNDMVAKSWWTKINYELTFNQFMKETYTIKTTIAELYQNETITDEELNEVENQITTLIQEIDIHNPKNFAYFYEIQICVTKYFNELLAKRYRKKVA